MLKRLWLGSVLFLATMGSASLSWADETVGMAGMSCDQCIQQCQQREDSMTAGNRLKRVGPATVSPIIKKLVNHQGPAAIVGHKLREGSCEGKCSRLSVHLCLQHCQQGGAALQTICERQCKGVHGSDHGFCLQTCLSTNDDSGCVQDCQQATC